MNPDWISEPPSPGSATVWPAVDVGGTSIRVLLLAADKQGRPQQVLPARRSPVQHGLGELLRQLRDSLAAASTEAASQGYRTAPVVALGSPGRIERRSDGARVIAPRSATNLESYPGELDGVALAEEIAAALQLPVDQVLWENDAVVQGRFLIAELLADPETAAQLLGRTLVCINPGTGLGGCVAEVAADGTVEVFTDSHVSELCLHPVVLERRVGPYSLALATTASAETLAVVVNARSESVPSPAGKQAEDLLSGSGIQLVATALERLAGELVPAVSLLRGADPGADIDGALLSRLLHETPAGPATSLATAAARFVADWSGRSLARLITVLHRGEARKCPGFPDWSAAELERLRGVSRFIIGGGITKTALGRHLVGEARRQLARISHQLSTTVGDAPPPASFSRRGVLDVLSSTPAHPLGRKQHCVRHLADLATTAGEKCGLAGIPDALLFEMDILADDAGAIGAFFLIPPQLRKRW